MKGNTLSWQHKGFCWETLGPGIDVDATWKLQTKYIPPWQWHSPVAVAHAARQCVLPHCKNCWGTAQKCDRELKASTWPPKFPRSQSDRALCKPDPWRPICGSGSDQSRHGHRTSEGVPWQQYADPLSSVEAPQLTSPSINVPLCPC